MNRDQLNSADAAAVGRTAIAILDRLQNTPAHIQATAAAAVFLTIAEHIKVPAQDLFVVTKNMMNDEDSMAEFNALRDYVRYELPK